MARTRHDAEWFWTDRWLGSSARELPMEARGLYREMLTAAWRRGASLPANHEAIRRLTACTEAEWGRCWPAVKGYWQETGDGRLSNETQVEVYQKTLQLSETRAKAGSAGGKASARSKATAKQTPEQPAEQAPQAKSKPPSPSPSPSPSPLQSQESTSTEPPAPSAPPPAVGAGLVCPGCGRADTICGLMGGGWTCDDAIQVGGCGLHFQHDDHSITSQIEKPPDGARTKRLLGTTAMDDPEMLRQLDERNREQAAKTDAQRTKARRNEQLATRKPSWSSEACDDWNARYGAGSAHGGKIGAALSPLVKQHGWEKVRPAWQRYLQETTHPSPNPANFREHFGNWLPSGKGAMKPGADRRDDAARALVAGGLRGDKA